MRFKTTTHHEVDPCDASQQRGEVLNFLILSRELCLPDQLVSGQLDPELLIQGDLCFTALWGYAADP